MYLRGKAFSLRLTGYTFKAYSSKGKALKISKVSTKDEKAVKSFIIPRGTKKIVSFYNKKKIQEYKLGKPLKKKRNFGVKRFRDILSKPGETSEERNAGLLTMREWFLSLGIKWEEIGSGQLPQKPYVKDHVFVFDAKDFKKKYPPEFWKIWVAVKGFGSSDKALRDKKGFQKEMKVEKPPMYWNLVSYVPKNLTDMNDLGIVAARNAQSLNFADTLTKQVVTAHNSRYVNGEVFTQWVNDFVFLGVEGLTKRTLRKHDTP